MAVVLISARFVRVVQKFNTFLLPLVFPIVDFVILETLSTSARGDCAHDVFFVFQCWTE